MMTMASWDRMGKGEDYSFLISKQKTESSSNWRKHLVVNLISVSMGMTKPIVIHTVSS